MNANISATVRPLLLIHGSVFLIFALLQFGRVFEVWEAKAGDGFFQLRRDLLGPAVASELVFIAIDDKSLDPGYSPHSDLWGRGGWLTRELWSYLLQFLGQPFSPRVVAFDILFRPNPPNLADPLSDQISAALFGEEIARARQLIDVTQATGNKEMQKQLWDLSETGAGGKPSPQALFAFDFVEDVNAEKRLQPTASSQVWTVLARYALPIGAVQSGSRARVYRVPRLPIAEIVDSPVWLGPINVPREVDGTIRRVPLLLSYESPGQTVTTRYMPSFSLMMFLLYHGILPDNLIVSGVPKAESWLIQVRPGHSLRLESATQSWEFPLDEELCLSLNPRSSYLDLGAQRVSFIDIVDAGLAWSAPAVTAQLGGAKPTGELYERSLGKAAELLKIMPKKLVIVAPAATGVGDYGPFSVERFEPNAMAHLLAVDNLLRRDGLRRLPVHWTLILLALLTVSSFLLYAYLRPMVATVWIAVGLVLVLACWMGAINYGQVMSPVLAPLGQMALLLGLNTWFFYRQEAAAKEQVRKMFSTMVSPRVLELMEENPDQFGLVGVKREATLFFSDLGGFTSISEKLSPTELCQLLNRYFTPMTDIILEHDGYLKDYAGDGIVAAWGLPYPDAQHAWKAVQSAWAQAQALEVLAAQILAETDILITMRIGINSGVVSAGNMGSQRRFQYGMMGDAVNLAARLEPINKDFGTGIILSEFTYAQVAERVTVRFLDKIVVKGKSVPVSIYELVGLREAEVNRAWIEAYEEGYAQYAQRDWDQAAAAFTRCQKQRGNDQASDTMLARIEHYRHTPPPAGWQGEFVKTTKG
jgi:class 3 adenylate cyclase